MSSHWTDAEDDDKEHKVNCPARDTHAASAAHNTDSNAGIEDVGNDLNRTI